MKLTISTLTLLNVKIFLFNSIFLDFSKAVLLTKRAGEQTSHNQRTGLSQQVQILRDHLRAQHVRQPAQSQGKHHQQHIGTPEAETEFKEFHTRMEREGKSVKGVLNIAIKGDPSVDHTAPKTSFREGEKGGKIVETFLQEPTPLNSPNYRSGEAPNGTLCVRIGNCQFITSNIHSTGASDDPRGRSSHTDIRTPNAANQMDRNIAAAERNKFKYAKTSTHTLANSHSAFHEDPDLLINAGKESGQYFSLLYRPDSPSHQQQHKHQQRVPSPPRREFSPIRALQPQLGLNTHVPSSSSSSRSPSSSQSHKIRQKRRFRD